MIIQVILTPEYDTREEFLHCELLWMMNTSLKSSLVVFSLLH